MTRFGEQPGRARGSWTKKPWCKAESLGEEIYGLLHNLAHRCARCKRPTDLEHLDDVQRCPDCRGEDRFR